ACKVDIAALPSDRASFLFRAGDGIRARNVTGVQTCALPIYFSVGETGPIRGPGRREIGQGALGEKALEKVVPSEDTFPYTIRLVSEGLESNVSSSQASICASTLAMMHGGVPIAAPVAGIAMGLIKTGENYSILTD